MVAAPLALAAMLLTVSGCGSTPSAAQAMPALGRELDMVDTAIAAGRDGLARETVVHLVSLAARGQSQGLITGQQAAAIVRAANSLLGALPSAGPNSGPNSGSNSGPSASATSSASSKHSHKGRQHPAQHGHGHGVGHHPVVHAPAPRPKPHPVKHPGPPAPPGHHGHGLARGHDH